MPDKEKLAIMAILHTKINSRPEYRNSKLKGHNSCKNHWTAMPDKKPQLDMMESAKFDKSDGN